ncbi:DciA family protein [Acuticoccus sp.]|uniref:DciA family protein n=1 Tax=Acuticoccus sp. TaxID=1904378 RepID=UPI003B51BD02
MKPYRRAVARPLAELIGPIVTPACRRRGIADAALLLDPADVFGAQFARSAAIERIVWPTAGREDTGATLVVRADAAAALALQHVAPQVVERANLLIGWPAIARLRLTQARGRACRPPPMLAPVPVPPAPPDAARVAAVAARLDGIDHPAVKAALSRLGARIEASGSPGRRKQP